MKAQENTYLLEEGDFFEEEEEVKDEAGALEQNRQLNALDRDGFSFL